MKKTSIFTLILSITLFSCSSDEKSSQKDETTEPIVKENITESKGYKLMEEKCFTCHFAKPDPSKKSEMIAPPMLRVQEHYKPNYNTKAAFVTAISEWVNNPQEENTLMPGAIRKFNVMPKLAYDKADLDLIAETLFDIEFGDMPKMKEHKNNGLELNNGKKWQIKPEAIEKIATISAELLNFKSDDIKKYNQLGKDVFDNAKILLLDKTYSEELFEQLHNFFNNTEKNMHNLISATSIENAEKEHKILIQKFDKFNNFFEAK